MSIRTLLGAAVGGAALLVPLVPTPASATYPGTNGFIAYTISLDTVDGGPDVYRELPDGSQVRRLTFDGTSSAPVFSPDGRTIAYADDLRLAFMRPDGTGKRRTAVPLSGRVQSHSWSPDGARLAVATPTGVSIVSRTGAVLRTIAVSGVTRVSFHPEDGDRLLVGPRTVLRLSTGTTSLIPVAKVAPDDQVDPVQWVPGTNRVAFVATCTQSGVCTRAENLFTAPVTGGPRSALTHRTTAQECDPEAGCTSLGPVGPSPDGRDFLLEESFTNGAGTTCITPLRVRAATCTDFGETLIGAGDWQARR